MTRKAGPRSEVPSDPPENLPDYQKTPRITRKPTTRYIYTYLYAKLYNGRRFWKQASLLYFWQHALLWFCHALHRLFGLPKQSITFLSYIYIISICQQCHQRHRQMQIGSGQYSMVSNQYLVNSDT